MRSISNNKDTSKFINFELFEQWYPTSFTKSEQQIRYEEKAARYTAIANEDEKNAKLDELENQFFSDLSFWSREKTKAEKQWNSGISMVCGVIRGAIDETLWLEIKELELPYLMWQKIKELYLTSEVGNILLFYTEFFDLKKQNNESLCAFLQRAQRVVDKLQDLGRGTFFFSRLLQDSFFFG